MDLRVVDNQEIKYLFNHKPTCSQLQFIGIYTGEYRVLEVAYTLKFKWHGGAEKPKGFQRHASPVLNALAKMFPHREDLGYYCNVHPEAKIVVDNLKSYYGFTSEHGAYRFYIRCFTGIGENNIRVFCYRQEQPGNIRDHVKKAFTRKEKACI